MNDDPIRAPSSAQPAAVPAAEPRATEGPNPGLPQPKIWPGMTREQVRAYSKGTRTRRSRKKHHPSLEKYRDVLIGCVEDEAVMRQVFDDLIQADPAVLEEFKADGHRAFNAVVKRMAG